MRQPHSRASGHRMSTRVTAVLTVFALAVLAPTMQVAAGSTAPTYTVAAPATNTQQAAIVETGITVSIQVAKVAIEGSSGVKDVMFTSRHVDGIEVTGSYNNTATTAALTKQPCDMQALDDTAGATKVQLAKFTGTPLVVRLTPLCGGNTRRIALSIT